MTNDVRAGEPLGDAAYQALLQRAAFDCCKWNLAFGDLETVARYPLLIRRGVWRELTGLAEKLAAEALDAERELAGRPDLWSRLGLSRGTAEALRAAPFSKSPRFARFDFHFTPEGPRITEGNCDVAAGFIEGSGVSALFARQLGKQPLGDPAGALASSIVRHVGRGARVGLLHLCTYTEDRQVVTYLGRRFEEAGLRTLLVDVADLRPGLCARTGEGEAQLDLVFRFFPADWLERLPMRSGWRDLLRSSRACNPGSALLTQSKRFPIVWPGLETKLPTWRALLPATRSSDRRSRDRRGWVLKPAFGHEGADVTIHGVTPAPVRRSAAARALRKPREWALQRRFQLDPMETPDGPRFACVGVHVVDGRTAGAYARVSASPIIDEAAQDAVVLMDER